MLFFLISVAALLTFSVAGAAAAFVTFDDIVDGDLSPQNFDVSTTTAYENTLNIGIDDFKADGAVYDTSALDTLSFKIIAPEGYWITKVTYYEGGLGQTTNGIAVATGSITANGKPKNFLTQIFGTNAGGEWTTSGSIDIDKAFEINVSIVNSLFAATFGNPGDIAWVEKDFARVVAQITPVPIPSGALLIFSGLACLVGLRRNNR